MTEKQEEKIAQDVSAAEEMLKDLKPKNEKSLEYSATTTNGKEKIKVDLKINTTPTNLQDDDNDLEKTFSSFLFAF